jgi:hypothetical protein
MNAPTTLAMSAAALALAALAVLELLPNGGGAAAESAAPTTRATDSVTAQAPADATVLSAIASAVVLGAALSPDVAKAATGGVTGGAPANASSGSGLSPRSWPTPPLSLRLNAPSLVQIGDRSWAILGTQTPNQGDVSTAVLVLRDESSGQLDYRQAALRFTLNAGGDYEATIAQIPGAKRVFANSVYAEIALEPADIGAAYARLKADARVATVGFSPLLAQVNKK